MMFLNISPLYRTIYALVLLLGTQLFLSNYSDLTALAEPWEQVIKHQNLANQVMNENLSKIASNPDSIRPTPPANYQGSPEPGPLTSTQQNIGATLVGKLGNPWGQCPGFKPKDCFCIEEFKPPICETRYYQAVEYRFPLSLAESGSLFQSDLIPQTLMRKYRKDLSTIFTPKFLETVVKQNYIWTTEGALRQGAPISGPFDEQSATQYIQQIANTMGDNLEPYNFFAGWTSGQTPMIGYHAVPAILARQYAESRAAAPDVQIVIAIIPMSCKTCFRCAWYHIIFMPDPLAYKVHQLKTKDMYDMEQWFASEAPTNSTLSYIPQAPQMMGPFGCQPRKGPFFYNEECVHRIKWQGRTHNLPVMSKTYFDNQARCFQKELGAGGYLEKADFLNKGMVFPAHKILSFAGYNDDEEPCLPYNLGPRIQFATNTQGPVFNGQHLGSIGAFLGLTAGGYVAARGDTNGVPLFAESNLGLKPPYGDLLGVGNMNDSYLFHKGNNIEGRSFTQSCGSYALPPLTGDYSGQEGYDKGLSTNNPNGVWIGSMWDWVRGFKRELTRNRCDRGIKGSECRDFHYAF